jgi:hypothetical protein
MDDGDRQANIGEPPLFCGSKVYYTPIAILGALGLHEKMAFQNLRVALWEAAHFYLVGIARNCNGYYNYSDHTLVTVWRLGDLQFR